MRITISLPDDLADLMKREAEQRRISVAEVARQALSEHFEATATARRSSAPAARTAL